MLEYIHLKSVPPDPPEEKQEDSPKVRGKYLLRCPRCLTVKEACEPCHICAHETRGYCQQPLSPSGLRGFSS